MKIAENSFLRNALIVILVSFFSLFLSFAFMFTDAYDRLESVIYDNFFRTVELNKSKTDSVAIVAIDDSSLIETEKRGVFWPWDRNMYAMISEYLIGLGAKAVVYDIIFSGPDMDRADSLPGAENDQMFHYVMTSTGKVVLPFNIDNRYAKNDFIETVEIENADSIENVKKYRYVLAPYSLFTENNKNFGYVDIDSESDGVVRKYRPVVKIGKKLYPSLALATYLISNEAKFPEDLELDKDGNFSLKWYGRGGMKFTRIPPRFVAEDKFQSEILDRIESKDDRKFIEELYKKDKSKKRYVFTRGVSRENFSRVKEILISAGITEEVDNDNSTLDYYSAWYVFTNALRSQRGRTTDINPETFKDKVVFVGASARGLLDQKNTPFTINGNAYPGVEIHATAYLNMVNRDWIKSNSIYIEFLVYFIILLTLAALGINAKSQVKYSILFFVLLFIGCFVTYVMFVNFNIANKIVLYIVAFLLLYFFVLITNYIFVGHNRNVIKNVFGTYLSPELVKKISDANKPIAAGGENINASALFVDIQGFTTFSEKNTPEVVVEVLNLYLKAFSEIIMNNKGFVNKFLGDGLMALFGAPENFEDHADMAAKSAIECYKINNELTKDYGLNVRIGVNSGKMIVGNMGGGKRLEYTAIGDNVNMASRFEGANKFFETRILVGENTFGQLKNKENFNYLGKFSVKGKDIPVGLYYFSDCDPECPKMFSEMVEAYEDKDSMRFEEMLELFKQKYPSFGPYLFYDIYYREHMEKFGEPIKFTEK